MKKKQQLYFLFVDIQFKRITVTEKDTGRSVEVQYRISKAAFLKDSEHELILKVGYQKLHCCCIKGHQVVYIFL
jgi:hypothetical protein